MIGARGLNGYRGRSFLYGATAMGERDRKEWECRIA
jgi:hypothetical protein